MKKLFTVAILVLSISFTAFAVETATKVFTDQDSFAPWYTSSALKAKNSGVVNGYADGSFKAGNFVNRAELVVMLDKFAQYMGKPMLEKPKICTEEFASGLTLYINDQSGQVVEGAQISVQAYQGLVSNSSFLEGEPGVYHGIGEGEGYYTFKITKSGYANHTESIKLEHDECHVIHQTRTITLISKPQIL